MAKDPEKQDSYILKLSGKAELFAPLTIGHNVKTTIEGSITAETISDNQDGSHTHYFKLEPIIVEAITEKGERLRAKDTRSRSQQLRSLLVKKWRESTENITQDEYYDREMVRIMGENF